jgi:hypothetical protein
VSARRASSSFRVRPRQRFGEEPDLSEGCPQLVRDGGHEGLALEREDSFAPHDEEGRDGQSKSDSQEPEDHGPPGPRQTADHERVGGARVQRDLGGEAAQRPSVRVTERPLHDDRARSSGPRTVDLMARWVAHRDGEAGHHAAVRGDSGGSDSGSRRARGGSAVEHLKTRTWPVLRKDDERARAVMDSTTVT